MYIYYDGSFQMYVSIENINTIAYLFSTIKIVDVSNAHQTEISENHINDKVQHFIDMIKASLIFKR
jgi:hypothetical protein